GVAERDALQTAEATDAMVDVDDVVAGLEVAKVGEERVRLAFLSADTRRGRRLEQIPFRIRDELQLFEDEAAPEVALSDGEPPREIEFLEQALDLFLTALRRGEEDLFLVARADVG